MNLPARVALTTDSFDPTTWQTAILAAEAIAQGARPKRVEFVLLTPTKGQLDGTSLVSAIGETAAKSLSKGDPTAIGNSAVFRHSTLRTLGTTARDAVIVVCYADDEMLDRIDGLPGVVGVVAVPEYPEQIERWIARWNPVIPGQTPTASVALITDPVVVKALEKLSTYANLANGALDPRVKATADETFRILRAHNHELAEQQIKSWAIKRGWKPSAALELAKMAGRIGSIATKPPLGRFENAAGKYRSWQE